MRLVNSVTDLIGGTPIVRLNRLPGSDRAEVWVKLEYFNPSRSIKDRAAYSMISQAEVDGLIQPGAIIIEPTSGNTGIGLAMVAAAKGYRLILTMPDNMTAERINIIRAFGAQVVLTPASEKMPGAIKKAEELREQNRGSIILQQFVNKANPEIHRITTAKEIFQQVNGKLDAFVATAGTGGTITGAGEVLKELIPGCKICVVEPEGSPVLSGGEPGRHNIPGTSPGFIPQVLNTKVYDEIFLISDTDALQTSQELATKEGILVGISAGAAVHTALKVAKALGPGKKVVAIAPDTGERYLSLL
ncbi:cysteine synthase A [Metallumcola ferriviriculae]|uniref:Cysteine synthase n=1 Tax=Metallumcola ferriviriculae TaxID=3039180 RepID=A0AAU0UMV6_9FIRM|nr:cysteine synthase A [Desulfitibacteraceae bacterium MK1]